MANEGILLMRGAPDNTDEGATDQNYPRRRKSEQAKLGSGYRRRTTRSDSETTELGSRATANV